MSTIRRIVVVAIAFFALASVGSLHAQCVSLTTLGSAYTQNFDTLSNVAGSTTNNLTIPGWFLTESGGGARDNEQYAVDTGGSTTGDMYSYGAAGSTERALGQLRSGTLIPVWGACFTNNTGATITSLDVAYNGEEWRLGTAARTDQINFETSTNATDLATGTWTARAALNFVTPDTATAGAKNGNAAADRTAISSTISSLSIPNGATFWIRWNDTDASGADDGLAVDDFSLTPQGGVVNNPPAITPPANPITGVAQDAPPFAVNVSGTDDNNLFTWSATPGTGVQSVSVTGGQGTATVTYTVTLVAGFSGTATFTATLSDGVNTAVNQAVNILVVAPPNAPTGLTATAGTSHIALSWTSGGGSTSYYNVKRSTTSGSGYAVINTPAGTSFDDTTVVDGTPYFYVVTAVGSGGESVSSSEVTATSMAVPTGVAATAGNAHVQLNWTAVAGATGYDVQRSTTSGSGYASIATPATNSYDDTTAANGTTYYYVVIATNANGTSLPSSEVSATPAAPGKIVISQIYGGGGATSGTPTYKNDYVELFNAGGTAVTISGWSLQYGSGTGNFGSVATNIYTFGAGISIAPGKYRLVQLSAAGTVGGNFPVAADDATTNLTMSAASGKVALANVGTALGCGATATPCNLATDVRIVDVASYGASNNGEGGTTVNNGTALTNQQAGVRKTNGCTDTDNNNNDFAVVTSPVPRNSATAANICGAPPANNPPAITAPANPAATVTQNAAPFTVNVSGTDDNNVFNWSATPGTGVQSVSVTAGQGTATATFTVTLQAGYTGTATFTATLSDNVNPAVNQAVNITVNPPAAPAAPTGLNAAAGDSHVQLTWNTVSGATSYNVKRSTTSGAETTIASPATNSYDDTTAVNGTTYFYVVSAVGAGGEGSNSSEVSATPNVVTPVPANLVAAVSNGSVSLTWGTVGTATSYNVKRSTASGGPYATIASPTSASYVDTVVTNGTRYFYVVSTVAPGTGESANSAQVHAKPDFPEALGVVISQVYGAGGNTGATYTTDFIELFNRGNSVVDLTGWSVQYASSTSSSWAAVALNGKIAPGQHYLIGEAPGAGGTTPLPAVDASGSATMSGTAGKVALTASTTALSSVCGSGVVDFVGYGSGANCFEGAGPTPNPSSNTNSLTRGSNGCIDNNNNATDFANATATPRNSQSAFTPCALTAIGYVTPSAVSTGGNATMRVELPPATTAGTVTVDLGAVGGSATQAFFDNGTNGDVTSGDNIFTFQPSVTASSGAKSLPVSATGSAQSATTALVVTVNPSLETIAAVKVDTTPADTVPDRLNQAVMVRGVVTSIDFRGGAGIEYYIQDPTGGIDVFSTVDVGPALALGTNVEVTGTVTQFNGLTELSPTSITTLPGGTLPAVTPQTVTLAQLLDGAGEPLEGTLVRVDNLTVTSGTFPAAGASGNVTVSDGTNTGTLRVDSDTDIDGTTTPGGLFSLIGLVSQSDASSPFDGSYQVLPRSLTDIIERTAPTGTGSANPPSVPPGGTTLLTVSVTLGQNPPSTGVSVVADLSSIGLSAAQPLFDNGTNGDVAPGDQIFSYSAVVSGGTALGAKSLPVQISDGQARSSSTTIPLFIQSASAPPTPLNLVATPGNAQVSLTWDASAGATGYNVKRSTTSGGPYATIVPNNASTSYTDTAVTNGVRYYYVVSALSGANESGNSSEATAQPSAPPPSGSLAKVYFVDIGQGAGTLIVSPSGKSLLVDGGPGGSATTELTSTLNAALGPSGKIDYLILTHYHVDHDAGLTDIINAGRVSPTGIAYDNGDAPNVIPPVPSNSTGTAFTAYKNALASKGISRQTAIPGTSIDLGGGMRATFMAAGGNLASGGHVWVSGTDLNSTSVSTLIEYNNFDFVISGDLTGGGSTTTAKTPDVETFVGQLARDVDFVQLDHHGSTTASGRRFLAQLKAEASLASAGATNTFGHPHRETVNKFLNTPATNGNTYGGEGVPPNPGLGPIFYQTDPSPATDNRTTVQGYSGADQAHAGLGTILLKTDGLVSFSMESFDDGGVRLNPNAHVYALDGQGNGLATDFPPTVIPQAVPAVPTAADIVTITALVNDVQPITSVTLSYSLNGAAQAPVTMTNTTGSEYAATIPAQPNGTRVDWTVTAVANGLSTSFANGYFAGTTTIATLRSLDALGEPMYLDYGARVSGLATSSTGNYSSSNNDDYLDDGTGAINISRTIEPASPATTPMSAGTNYTVAGFINELNGRFRLDVTPPFDGVDKPWATAGGTYNPYSITTAGSGTVTPLTRTIAQILADGEGNEAKLVSIANCTVTSGTIPGSGGADAFLTVSDGTGTIEMKIDGDSQIFGTATPAGTFTLVGIVQQDDFLRPFTTRYDVSPRTAADLGGVAGGPSLITIAEARADVDSTTGLTPGDYVPDRLGQKVKVRGVVTSVDFRGATGTEVYIQDQTGGIDLFSTSINTTLNLGDNLEVTGTIAQFNGLTELTPAAASDITILAPGTLPNPVMEVVTLSQLANNGPGESFEGKLLRINNVTLAAPPATFAANTNYNINDATGTVQMRIDSDTDIDGTAPPAGTFSVIGVLGQFDNASPFDSGYQLFPRIRATDFLPAVPAANAINAVAGTPQTATINTAFATQLQASVTDASNNPIDGIGVTFTAPGSGASGTFPGGLTTVTVATNASGIATAPVFTANSGVGSYTVVASVGGLTANFSLTNVSNAATHFSVTAPATVTNGSSFSVTVTALTGSNAVATGYTGTVHFTSTSGGTLPSDYTFTGGDSGTHTFNVTLTTNGAQTVTATDTGNGTINGSANLTVNPATPVATHVSVSAPANVTNGVPFSVTVTALDSSNATVTGYTGTIHFTSSSAGTLPSDYTFTGVDGGAHTFTVTLTTTGAQTLTATDTVDASINGTANITVDVCNAPTVPTISGSTNGTGTQDQACPEQPLTLTASSTGAMSYQWYKDIDLLPGETGPTYQATGAATYYVTATNNCGTTVQSAGYVVQNPTPHSAFVTATGTMICAGGSVRLTSDSATGIQWYKDNVAIPGANSQSYLATSAGSYTAQLNALGCHSSFSNTIVLTSSGSTAPNGTITAPAAVLSGSIGNPASVVDAGAGATYSWSATGATIASGQGTSNITFNPVFTFGTITLYVTVTTPDGCTTSSSANVSVLGGEGVATHFVVSAPASAAAGTPFTVTVTAQDSTNITAVTYAGAIHFTSSSAGTLPADYTFTPADGGVHTFSVTLNNAGTRSVTVTDTTTPAVTGSTNINITAGAPATITTVSGSPQTATVNTAFAAALTARVADAFNNPVSGASVTFAAPATGASGTFGGAATVTTDASGIATAPTFTANAIAGTYSATATVAALSTSFALTNVALPATHFSVTAPSTATAGAPFSVVVSALDSSNGVVTGYTGTVQLTTNTGLVLGSHVFVPGDGGTASISVTINTQGAYTITASDGSISGTSGIVAVTCPVAPGAEVIAVASSVCAGSTGNTATANSATATSYSWSITNGTITAGQGTRSITFTAGTSGDVVLTVTPAFSTPACSNTVTGSATVHINAAPTARVDTGEVAMCGGSSVTIRFTLTGVAPFTVTWSDGVVQTVTTTRGTRVVSPDRSRRYSIDTVSDSGSCAAGIGTGRAIVNVDAPPAIVTQPSAATVRSGQRAELTVVATGGDLRYAWYEGASGDTSNFVGEGASLETLPLGRSTKFWVRVSNGCGSVDSAAAEVTVATGRRRAADH